MIAKPSAKSKHGRSPLKSKEVSLLILLEEKSQQKSSDKKSIKSLIDIYAKLIEFYDLVHDPIKNYFMDKMQSAIFNFNIKMNQPKKEDYLSKYKSKMKGVRKRLDSLRCADENLQKNVDKLIKTRKTKKNFEIKMQERVEKTRTSVKESLQSEIMSYRELAETNSNIVSSQLSTQNETVNQRLLKRKQRSISRSLQRSLTSFVFDKSGYGHKNSASTKDDTLNRDLDSPTKPFLLNIYQEDAPYQEEPQ